VLKQMANTNSPHMHTDLKELLVKNKIAVCPRINYRG